MRMRKLLRARVIAPFLHALLFAIAFPLAQASTNNLGPAKWPLFILWLADLPFSIIAQLWSLSASDALRTRTESAWIPWALWGVTGTVWWFFLGISIEAWIKRFSKKT
jgi:hypothetical protein